MRTITECTWSGHKPFQTYIVHRTVHHGQSPYQEISCVEFTDGTTMDVHHRAAKPHEEVQEIHGYDVLLEKFQRAGMKGYCRVEDLQRAGMKGYCRVEDLHPPMNTPKWVRCSERLPSKINTPYWTFANGAQLQNFFYSGQWSIEGATHWLDCPDPQQDDGFEAWKDKNPARVAHGKIWMGDEWVSENYALEFWKAAQAAKGKP